MRQALEEWLVDAIAHLRVDRVHLSLVGLSLVIDQRSHHEGWEDSVLAVRHDALRDERRLNNLPELHRRRRRRVEDKANRDRAGGQHCKRVCVLYRGDRTKRSGERGPCFGRGANTQPQSYPCILT